MSGLQVSQKMGYGEATTAKAGCPEATAKAEENAGNAQNLVGKAENDVQE
jgi:hypothetical protein